jgi:uncharacterized protein YjaG (DUF416 family)
MAAEELLDGEASNLTRKAIDLALAGDTVALRLCLERILPPRKDRPLTFALPAINSAADASKAHSALLAAVASGSVTPGEAAEVSKLIEGFVRIVEVSEMEDRLTEIEQRMTQ